VLQSASVPVTTAPAPAAVPPSQQTSLPFNFVAPSATAGSKGSLGETWNHSRTETRGASFATFVNQAEHSRATWITAGWRSWINFATTEEYVPRTSPVVAIRGLHFIVGTVKLLADVPRFLELAPGGIAAVAAVPGQHDFACEVLTEVFEKALAGMGSAITEGSFKLSQTARRALAGDPSLSPAGPAQLMTLFTQVMLAGPARRDDHPFGANHRPAT
jgi:hypothetical protein